MTAEKRGNEKRDAIQQTSREYREHQRCVTGREPSEREATEKVRRLFEQNERKNTDR
jgi:hypothetical protein